MSDFDWMPTDELAAIAAALRKAMDKDGNLPAPESPFWATLPGREDDDEEDLSELAGDVGMELDGARLNASCEAGLFTGDLCCAESRLSLMLNEVKAVMYVASHEMEPLWDGDGIKYHTVVISPAIEPSKTLSAQLTEACSFLKANRPALICSSNSALPAVVLTAAIISAGTGDVSVEAALDKCRECGALSAADAVGADELRELEAFDESWKRAHKASPTLAVATEQPTTPRTTGSVASEHPNTLSLHSPTEKGTKRARNGMAKETAPRDPQDSGLRA
jgi:hypothetical protein